MESFLQFSTLFFILEYIFVTRSWVSLFMNGVRVGNQNKEGSSCYNFTPSQLCDKDPLETEEP